MANGSLGKAMSQANSNVTVYTVPGNVQFAVVNINLCNTGGAEATAKIALTTSANPSAADYIDKGSKIPANGGILERTCMTLSPGEKVIVEVDNALTAIRVHGLEKA